jgi:hypothetical protein
VAVAVVPVSAWPGLLFPGAGEHPFDQSDVDRLGVQGAPAGRLDPVGAVAADQAEQPVDLAHLGPGQRVVEHRGGVGANGGAVRGGAAGQRVDIAQRVGGGLGGQIGRVGVAAPRGAGGNGL